MTENELFGNSEQLNDLISRQAAISICDNAIDLWNGQLGTGVLVAVRDAIMALPSAQRWIPCKERLPEYGTAVLTYNNDDEYEINHIIDEDDGEWFFNGAVAWMPLPEPYREDTP